jgi:hypothetical protein
VEMANFYPVCNGCNNWHVSNHITCTTEIYGGCGLTFGLHDMICLLFILFPGSNTILKKIFV